MKEKLKLSLLFLLSLNSLYSQNTITQPVEKELAVETISLKLTKEFKQKSKNDSIKIITQAKKKSLLNNSEDYSSFNSLLSLKTLIRTKDFEASKAFYTQILNLEIIEEYDDGNGSKGVIMRFGPTGSNAFFEISEISDNHSYYQEKFSKNLENDKIDIQLRTDNIEFWAMRLKEKWKARGPIDRPWGSKYLYLRDPDGLQIIIYQEKSK